VLGEQPDVGIPRRGTITDDEARRIHDTSRGVVHGTLHLRLEADVPHIDDHVGFLDGRPVLQRELHVVGLHARGSEVDDLPSGLGDPLGRPGQGIDGGHHGPAGLLLSGAGRKSHPHAHRQEETHPSHG
jgi:hypothetical protein